ncbi:MAG: Radical domain protein, partial [Phycisphaerales bacterium]|nr:Radical domain protein [Phycisphaerales bacterium]
MITPSAGTKLYEQTFTTGQVFDRVGGRTVKPHMHDGNYVVASMHKRPWKKQLNLLMGYLYFYNPVWLAAILLRKKTRVSQKAAAMQIVGMLGVTQTIRRTFSWAIRLMFGQVERLNEAPGSALPMRSVEGHPASHAACGPTPPTPKLLVTLRVPKRQREPVH